MITAAEWNAGKGRPKRNKYGVSSKADRTWGGRLYASKAEMEYARSFAPAIVEQQIIVLLGPSGITMIVDFLGRNGVYVDVKGAETPAFRLKCRLWQAHGPAPLKLVKLVRGEWKTLEIITPGEKRQARPRKKRKLKEIKP